MNLSMLAPCGINCAACFAHLRKNKTCPGCRGQEDSQPPYCRRCNIRNCAVSRAIQFCFECSAFPCTIIKRIDKRYRLRYQVNLIQNGLQIKTLGVETFLDEEKKKWACPQCGGVICMHDRICSVCGLEMKPTV